ncbi:MAG TPA: GNAT family N-acetyltransferase [Oxalicibacterium sp.]|uniref:GNAT family N-acetyltransferase n=1 Tax=Oxalicibacterium sp. TaxID=2766525 RepID=UPI002B9C9D87|nr:GNAT family N-acetyltransferase [Oxalicibacterium sp.]HWU97836.1 GNAT family N-acetyltransferase [Oxalicibacterium sp.]
MQMESEAQRFEWSEDGRLFGFVDYYRFGNIVVITHTETNPAWSEKGLGSRLAAKAVTWMEAEGLRIVPVCSFMAHFLRTHAEYHDVVTPAARKIFQIG